jgi:hypothetical protein
MFMAGCPPELEARRHRIACRQLVQRNVLALADGVRRTLFWSLAPEVPGPVDPYVLMHLLVGKLPLLDYDARRELTVRYPEADTFALLANHLTGVECVTRVELTDQPTVLAFNVHRTSDDVTVVWERRDTFAGEADPPVGVDLPWSSSDAHAVDAFGQPRTTTLHLGRLHLEVTDTPVFIWSSRLA